MTVFPGSELNKRLLQTGVINRFDVEGDNTKRSISTESI